MTLSYDGLLYMSASFAFFMFVYKYVVSAALRGCSKAYESLPREKRVGVDTSLMALLHSTLVGSMALYLFLFSDVITPTVIRQEVPLLKLAVCILVGYIMADTSVLVCNPTADVYDWSMFVHHVICLYTGYAAAVSAELPYYQLQWTLMELFNPFNNLRFILKELGQKTSTLYLMNGIALVGMFFLARVAPIPFFWYHLTSIIQSEDFSGVTFSMKVVALVLSPTMHLLNLFWFYKIFTGLLKYLSTKAEKKV
ncbi:TLC domain-containing protein 4-B-like [Branchiostoma floridae]|uniref:TLC domain-containing protein 4-B-like n=1 Tax=Branchiostoma floridae TaxID=7739 RepID=A0A9J7KKB4_BRAFL|nr:TLC domain-containing protein 4-B-like [Branchiostoma floridae]